MKSRALFQILCDDLNHRTRVDAPSVLRLQAQERGLSEVTPTRKGPWALFRGFTREQLQNHSWEGLGRREEPEGPGESENENPSRKAESLPLDFQT